MSSASGEHGQDHAELVFLYALDALPASDMAVVEAHLSACADCRQEMETLGPIVGSFVSWPTDVLRPSASLRGRLAQRIAAETGAEPVSPGPPRWAEPEWSEVAPGISCKLLATDTEERRVSMLVRLAPGTDYPPHRHAGVEELYMLDGELIVDDERFHPGDYRRGEAGDVDHRVWSETGCTCVLITSLDDAILSGHVDRP
jgi:anti-sigma factor ChrR (cupin superfamily)